MSLASLALTLPSKAAALTAGLRVPVPPATLDAALAKLSGSKLSGVVEIYKRHLGQVPGFDNLLVQLANVLYLPGHRRGVLGGG